MFTSRLVSKTLSICCDLRLKMPSNGPSSHTTARTHHVREEAQADLKTQILLQYLSKKYRWRILIWSQCCRIMQCRKCRTCSGIWGLKWLLKFVISTLKFPIWFSLMKNVSTPTKRSINYKPCINSRFLGQQDHFPAVANWLKLRSYIGTSTGLHSISKESIKPHRNSLFAVKTGIPQSSVYI